MSLSQEDDEPDSMSEDYRDDEGSQEIADDATDDDTGGFTENQSLEIGDQEFGDIPENGLMLSGELSSGEGNLLNLQVFFHPSCRNQGIQKGKAWNRFTLTKEIVISYRPVANWSALLYKIITPCQYQDCLSYWDLVAFDVCSHACLVNKTSTIYQILLNGNEFVNEQSSRAISKQATLCCC